MDILDRIAQGYFGELGEKVQEDSCKRIQWICNHVTGKTVLDIGCSQGICELLLAREGYSVVGIDIVQESIDYAKKLVESEPDSIKNNIEFLCEDYLKKTCFEQRFDTILLTEVLEHLEFPELMLEKAMRDLKDDGEIIVTVPFGINDFPDHKHTFYMFDILNMLSQYVQVSEIEFMGGWIGFYAKRIEKPERIEQIDKFLLKREEQAFFTLERPLRDQIIRLNEFSKSVNEKYKKAEENYQTVKKWFANKQAQNETLQQKISNLEQEQKYNQQKIKEKDSRIAEIENMLKKSYGELSEDAKLLETLKRQLQQVNAKLQLANVKNKEYEIKLNKVYGTWYGRIALKIYKVLKKVKGVLH